MADRDTRLGNAGGTEPGGSGGATDKAREIKDQAQEKVAHVASEARDRGEELVEEGKDKAREIGEQAVEAARSRTDEQRERVAEGVRTFAYALRRGADDLPQDRREYERYIDDVADRVESVSRYIQERDVDSLTREARRFARDHTPVFLAGAFTLGLLGARFIKSSGDEAREQRYGGLDRDRDPTGWTGPYDQTSPYASEGRHGRSAPGYGRPSTGAEGGGYG